MPSRESTVANGVKTLIESGSYSVTPAEVKYTYFPKRNLKEMLDGKYYIDVVPKTKSRTLVNRAGHSAETYGIDVGIRKRVSDPDDTSEVEPVLALREEIEDRLINQQAAITTPDAMLINPMTMEPLWSQEVLEEHSVVMVVATFTYKVLRS